MTASKNKQRGYGQGIAKAMTAFIAAVAIVSAIGGWALIEGVIWLFSHVTIGWAK